MEDSHSKTRRTVLKSAGGAIAGLSLLGSSMSASAAQSTIPSDTIKLAYTNRYSEAVNQWWQPRADINNALESRFDREDVITDVPDENPLIDDQDVETANAQINNQNVEYLDAELSTPKSNDRNQWDLYLEEAITDEVGISAKTSFVVLDYLPEAPYGESDPMFFQPIRPFEFACAIGVNWRFVEERRMDIEQIYPELYNAIQQYTPPEFYCPYGFSIEGAAINYSLLQTLLAVVFEDTDDASAMISMPYAGGMVGPW